MIRAGQPPVSFPGVFALIGIGNMNKKSTARARVEHHKDGSVCARGTMLDGELHGYWEWFRKDGSRMRSGHFDRGAKIGQWITYDRNGTVYKVTETKVKS